MLNLFKLTNGIEAPFTGASTSDQISLSAFTYNATRMGGAPTISATLFHPVCLDDYWTDGVYVKYKDERYFIKQIPTSSYSNEDIMYKHELEFVSERIALENVYFYDVVDAEFDDDKPVSNKSEFSFSGDIHQFAERLNQSLQYAGLEYSVVVDDGIESDDKLVTVENNFFSAVLQDIYNVYDLPYYFVGKVIHIGHSANAIDEVFSYGAENALLSVTKTNAGNRVINRITGLGGEDNIPYYYPNLSPKGDIQAKAGENNIYITDNDITIIDYEKYAENVALDGVISTVQGYCSQRGYIIDYGKGKETYNLTEVFEIDKSSNPYDNVPVRVYIKLQVFQPNCNISIEPTLVVSTGNNYRTDLTPQEGFVVYEGMPEGSKLFLQEKNGKWEKLNLPVGTHEICFVFNVGYYGSVGIYQCYYSQSFKLLQAFYYEGKALKTETVGGYTYLPDVGLKLYGTFANNDTITQKLVRYINPQKNLMPPIYRETFGAERFYNALNNTYQNPEEDEGIYYEFENPFVEGRPKEQIVQFDEVKPTIKDVKNSEGLRIDMFSEFAYDRDDNDDIYTDANGQTNYTHPYFFGKLRKLDFNLFDSAIDEGEMTIAMTSGNCGACEFIVGVDSESKKNTVQVDENGNLVYDSNGNVLCGRQDLQNQVDPQPQQQDTINNEVWIALEKDTKTFGVLIPNVEEDYKPKACTKNDDGTYNNDGDTFVILHISLPQLYIERAEEELYDQIIRFMYDNNFEKFNFSIKFSRIYLAEHPEILALLDENARIKILYNGQEHLLYVSSYSYKITDNEVLPEITVELKDNLAVSQNAVQRAVNKAVADVYKTIGNIDVVAQANAHFLRSDQPDVAYQQITFDKTTVLNNGATIKNGGIKSDDYYSDIRGLAISKDDDGNWHIETDYLKARKKISAKEVEIQKVYHIGGAQIKSSANMICSRVEDAGDAYRCYMETTDDSGNTIYNQFVAGDQAYVQTFNLITDENGDTTNHFYWRLVMGVGDNFILLSKTICADGSTIPMVGDNIVQLGCQDGSRPERMVAVIDAGAGADAPYYRQFVGIRDFSLPEPETQLKPNDNIFTGRITAKAGSVLPVATRNLLRNSKEVVVDDNTAVSHGYVFTTLPLPKSLELKEGDKLTFNTESFSVTAGSATKAEISLFTCDPVTNSPISRVSEPAYISEDNLTATLTFSSSVTPRNTDTKYALLFYAGEWGNTYGNRVEYTKCSLVEGESPMVVWNDSIETQVNTTIDNGIITSGTIQLGDSNATAKAGITGAGFTDDSIRIWAGSGETDMANAPFKVQQDGTLYASRGIFGGLIIKSKTTLNADNIADYLSTEFMNNGTEYVDLIRTGTFIECVDLDDSYLFWLKGISVGYATNIDSQEYKDSCRSMVGNTLLLYNNSAYAHNITGVTGRKILTIDNNVVVESYTPFSFSLSPNRLLKAECKLVDNFGGSVGENIIWVCEAIDISNS